MLSTTFLGVNWVVWAVIVVGIGIVLLYLSKPQSEDQPSKDQMVNTETDIPSNDLGLCPLCGSSNVEPYGGWVFSSHNNNYYDSGYSCKDCNHTWKENT